MALTPDRHPGESDEEGLVLEDVGSDPVAVGSLRNNGGTLKAKDSAGVFNLRQAGGPIADWSTSAYRYYAVDYDAGSDSNLGYSDVSMAAAGTVAIKTLEKLRDIFPKVGNGRLVVIAIKARAGGAVYRNAANTADDELNLNGIIGYQHVLVRGTGTVTTAGATAFANDAADRVALGAHIFVGTNTAGYNPTGSPTTSVIQCVLNGGGPPGLAAEPALIGKRIRFKSDTATIALRNVCRMIWQNTTDTITVDVNLPATPTASDVFYIEEPAVSVDRIQINTFLAGQASIAPFHAGISIVGIRVSNTNPNRFHINSVKSRLDINFCDTYSQSTLSYIDNINCTNTYLDDAGGAHITGVGLACSVGGMSCANSPVVVMSSVGSRGGVMVFNGIDTSFRIGSSSAIIGASLSLSGCKNTPGAHLGAVSIVGNEASATNRRLRITGGAGTVVTIANSDITMFGVDIQNAGISPLILVHGLGSLVSISDVVGSTGNTGTGMDINNGRDMRLLLGQQAANTFTGAVGQDIFAGGGVYYVHADYARTDLKDKHNNSIQGSNGTKLGSLTYVANDGNANIGQYKIVRATSSGSVRAAQADSTTNAGGIVGVSQHSFTTAQSGMLVNGGNTWVQFDSPPTVGSIAYLSTLTAGNAQIATPALFGTNQKVRLGRISHVSGTLGLVAWNPDVLHVAADGNP